MEVPLIYGALQVVFGVEPKDAVLCKKSDHRFLLERITFWILFLHANELLYHMYKHDIMY